MRFLIMFVLLWNCISVGMSYAAPIEDLYQKAEKMSGRTLTFQGFYLGMPLRDAQMLINHHLDLEQVSYEVAGTIKVSEIPGMEPGSEAAKAMEMLKKLYTGDNSAIFSEPESNRQPYRIYQRNDQLVLTYDKNERPFAVADQQQQVVSFDISEALRNQLFGSDGMTRDEFLQAFINAYDIPRLNGDLLSLHMTYMGSQVEVGVQGIYRYRSDNGFELTYHGPVSWKSRDAAGVTSYVPPEHLIIKKIQRATFR